MPSTLGTRTHQKQALTTRPEVTRIQKDFLSAFRAPDPPFQEMGVELLLRHSQNLENLQLTFSLPRMVSMRFWPAEHLLGVSPQALQNEPIGSQKQTVFESTKHRTGFERSKNKLPKTLLQHWTSHLHLHHDLFPSAVGHFNILLFLLKRPSKYLKCINCKYEMTPNKLPQRLVLGSFNPGQWILWSESRQINQLSGPAEKDRTNLFGFLGWRSIHPSFTIPKNTQIW